MKRGWVNDDRIHKRITKTRVYFGSLFLWSWLSSCCLRLERKRTFEFNSGERWLIMVARELKWFNLSNRAKEAQEDWAEITAAGLLWTALISFPESFFRLRGISRAHCTWSWKWIHSISFKQNLKNQSEWLNEMMWKFPHVHRSTESEVIKIS